MKERLHRRISLDNPSDHSATLSQELNESEETPTSIPDESGDDEDVDESTLDVLDDIDSLLAGDDEIIFTVTQEPLPTIIKDERPPLNRPVQVDDLLNTWRTRIRNTGMKVEEEFISAVQDAFHTEKERESVICRNMFSELNNTIEGGLISLKNTIMYLAKKGKATKKNDPRLNEFNDALIESRIKIRNRAVELRSPHCITKLIPDNM